MPEPAHLQRYITDMFASPGKGFDVIMKRGITSGVADGVDEVRGYCGFFTEVQFDLSTKV